MPSTNLARAGAQLVHPDLAFVISHIQLPDDVEQIFESDETMHAAYVSPARWERKSTLSEVRIDYILRVQASVETLFGPMEFDRHSCRTYPEGELRFHSDPENPFFDEDDEDEKILEMVTCVHNATDHERHLTFQKPTWTNHLETFRLAVPAKKILAFGQALMFEYQHGIPKSPEVIGYRSIVTRFAKWG